MARLGKRERQALKVSKAAGKVRKVRVGTIAPAILGIRSAWDNMIPHGKPRAAWGYDANVARSLHKPWKVRHVKE
mgnify:CR=1